MGLALGLGLGIFKNSGDGYGPVLNISTCENGGYTTFANATSTGFDAISDGGATHYAGTADEISFVSGEKFLVEFDAVINSGTAPVYRPRYGFGLGDLDTDGPQTVVNGHNIFEFTIDITTTGILEFRNPSQVTDFEITNLSVRKKL